MKQYIQYINEHASQHPHAAIATKVLECLDHIQHHIDQIAQLAGTSNLFRHPTNHMAVHLSNIPEPGEAKIRMQGWINDMCAAFDYLMGIDDPKIKKIITSIFLSNIIDSDVGCMEVRIKEALFFIGMYQATGILEMKDIMGKLISQANGSPTALDIIDYFHLQVEHHMPVRLEDNSLVPLSWTIIKECLKTILSIDSIEADWQAMGKQLIDSANVSQNGRWHIYQFKNETMANRCLSYIKSVAPADQEQDLAKASVKLNGKRYTFTLTPTQQGTLTSQHSSTPSLPVQVQVPVHAAPVKRTHKMIFDETIERLSTITTPIDWRQEQINFIAAHPKAWRDRKFYMRFHAINLKCDLIVTHSEYNVKWKFLCFSNKDKADRYLILSKLMLADKHPNFIAKGKVAHVNHYPTTPFRFRMTEEQHNDLSALLIPDDLLVKSIRMDKDCFTHNFMKGITPSPVNSEKPKLRRGPHLRYTVYGHSVVDRTLKKGSYGLSPYVISGQVHNAPQLKKLKEKTSRHQSCSLITTQAQPKVFGHNAARENKLAGFIFSAREAAWNRLFIYDGGTINRPYEFDNLNQAQNYYNTKVLCSSNPYYSNRVLFADMARFKQAIAASTTYNEVLARLRFNINTTSVGIFCDTFESRCTAQYFASIMRRRLKEQYQEKNLILDESYQVPITYYIPGHEKNNGLYTPQEQEADKILANTIAADPAKLDGKINITSLEFLYLQNIPDKIFNIAFIVTHHLYNKIKFTNVPVIIWLVHEGLFDLAEELFKRTSLYKDRASYLAYLNGKCIYPITRFSDGNSLLHVLAKCNQVDMLPIFFQHLDTAQTKALLEQRNNIGESAIDVAENYHAKEMHDELMFLYRKHDFLNACEKGNHLDLQRIINSGIDINITDHDGNTGLHLACKSGSLVCVNILLANNANINIPNKSGQLPFDIAISGNNTNIVFDFISAHPELSEKTNERGETPLYIACEKGNIKLVELLISKKVDVNKQTNNGLTPLSIAMRRFNYDIVCELLKSKPSNINVLNGRCETPLHVVCREGRSELIKTCLESNIDVNTLTLARQSVLQYALMSHDIDTIREVVNLKPTNVNVRSYPGESALHIFCREGNLDLVKTLLSLGANVNAETDNKKTPLYFALSKGHIEIIEALLQSNANDINTQNDERMTALHLACFKDQLNLFNLLMAKNPNLNIVDSFGNMPLHYACKSNDTAMMNALVEARADINAKDCYGETPLMHACKTGNIDFAHRLIAAKANINLTDYYENTALHFACCRGDVAMIEELIASGATVSNVNVDGKTPFELSFELLTEPQKTDIGFKFALAATEKFLSTMANSVPEVAATPKRSFSLFSISKKTHTTHEKHVTLKAIIFHINEKINIEQFMLDILQSDPQLSSLATELGWYVPGLMPSTVATKSSFLNIH